VTPGFVIEPLAARHDRAAFSCGVEPLDRYLRTQAGQEIRRHISHCFVAVPAGGNIVAGYYTLAASSVSVAEIPAELSRKLPRYPVLPAVLIGRLAVDRQFTRRSLGAALLYDAISRAARADPAVYTLIVDAKNEAATDFYRRFGFRAFVSKPLSLFLPMAVAAKLLAR
jgi:ribosomal protein S18 acetylase RimI-like enzyme